MVTFKEFASQGKFVRLQEIGDSIELLVKKDPNTLVPREGKYKDLQTGELKLVLDYVFETPDTKQEKVFTNGSQSFAQQMAKLKVGDLVKIIKVEKDGKGVYAVRRTAPSPGNE